MNKAEAITALLNGPPTGWQPVSLDQHWSDLYELLAWIDKNSVESHYKLAIGGTPAGHYPFIISTEAAAVLKDHMPSIRSLDLIQQQDNKHQQHQ